ncbi:MAG: GNAT family N-acetyltransferase [Planctomycetota bacterium]
MREVIEADLPTFYKHQLDPDAGRMAAFTARDPTDKAAFMAHWARIMRDERVVKRTILADGEVAGHVVHFHRDDTPEVCYWIGKRHWGRGLATRALAEILNEVTTRPLYARAAQDNVASIRVLEKCGFEVCGSEKAYANARGKEIEEAILKLD